MLIVFLIQRNGLLGNLQLGENGQWIEQAA